MSQGNNLSSSIANRITSGAKRCAICGSRHIGRYTIDHVIPVAVIKWSGVSEECARELYRDFNSMSNLIPACVSCNVNKGAYIPTDSDINSLFINDAQKKEIKELMKKHSDTIEKYNSFHTELYNKYNGICQCGCGRLCNIMNTSVMRIDINKGRYFDNGVIIHNRHCCKFSKLKDRFSVVAR